jgi:hypothetical protein
MEPNNNQTQGINPINQAVGQVPPSAQEVQAPITATPIPTPSPVQPLAQPISNPPPVIDPNAIPAPPVMPESPKGKGGKLILLLIIVLLIVIGMIVYIFYAKNQMKTAEKPIEPNTTVLIPSPKVTPTLTPEEELQVSSPEADLKDIETELEAL